MDTILVTGGTGVLGRRVVRRLLEHGRPVRVLSRHGHRPEPVSESVADHARWAVGDLTDGTGLAQAMEGVGTIVHCASDVRHWKNDPPAAARLIDAARAAGNAHVVYVSIVGIDRVPFGYYQAKLEVEGLIASCGLPWTVLRTTQFHDLVLAVGQRLARLPLAMAPAGVVTQPIDVGEVAARLAELAVGEPAGRVGDMGGPKVWTLAQAVRAVQRTAGRPRRVVEIPLPGKAMAAVRDGALLTPDHAYGPGFERFLADAPITDRAYGSAQRPR